MYSVKRDYAMALVQARSGRLIWGKLRGGLEGCRQLHCHKSTPVTCARQKAKRKSLTGEKDKFTDTSRDTNRQETKRNTGSSEIRFEQPKPSDYK
ncbi:unnamed protein product [Chondrus crispus]|uniref:Uncharacterized protein n=1 Tax=Chondrus crispus TaxID=2769 RepID=R7QL09_CHOCR|nr:unnamed protein product [Chondrus crispus]CDF38070.1 unnamed protein product [Chondrus crispus]|eukprot:XP_005717939.1 unnamed protein product [Chondrus crispus]